MSEWLSAIRYSNTHEAPDGCRGLREKRGRWFGYLENGTYGHKPIGEGDTNTKASNGWHNRPQHPFVHLMVLLQCIVSVNTF